VSERKQGGKEGRSAQMSKQLFKHVTVRGAGISIGGVRESVGSWSNSHRFIPLKQKVCLRSVAYDTNSGSSSPMVIVTCRQPRPLRSISRAYPSSLFSAGRRGARITDIRITIIVISINYYCIDKY
jgi:hypothetical protein